MIRYIELPDACRSSYISWYFGDTELKDCGVCDNCLAKKRKTLSPEEFKLIETKIRQSISESLSVEHFFSAHPSISREKIWTVLTFLQAEHVLSVDEQGILRAMG